MARIVYLLGYVRPSYLDFLCMEYPVLTVEVTELRVLFCFVYVLLSLFRGSGM